MGHGASDHKRHFFVFPSAKPEIGTACARAWADKGYSLVIGCDRPEDSAYIAERVLGINFIRVLPEKPFPGYYRVINGLVALAFNGGADLVTVGGDDQTPPNMPADEFSRIYFSRFPDGDGVMQACGDPQGELIGGVHNAARICGSPTFGYGWYRNSYVGGPFHEGYRSYFGDEDLFNFAKQCNKLWMNFDVTIDHEHWAFGRRPRQDYHVKAEANWDADKALFEKRKAEGFPA